MKTPTNPSGACSAASIPNGFRRLRLKERLKTAAADMGGGSGDLLGVWSPIASAPKDGTRFKARGKYARFVDRYKTTSRRRVLITWWGKASHVPLYGWCHGRDIEDIDLWEPTEWHSPNITLSHAGTSARKQDGAATGVGSGNS